jgi:hypothetical protein
MITPAVEVMHAPQLDGSFLNLPFSLCAPISQPFELPFSTLMFKSCPGSTTKSDLQVPAVDG